MIAMITFPPRNGIQKMTNRLQYGHRNKDKNIKHINGTQAGYYNI